MTKKDYIKFAEILKRHTGSEGVGEYDEAVNAITSDLINLFEKDNPRFDRQRFIDYINK